MIRFFKLKHSVNHSIIGVFPQVDEAWPWAIDRQVVNSYTRTPIKGRIEFDIVFPEFKLNVGAKRTDWMSSVNIGRNYLMVSTRLLELLKGFILDEYQLFAQLVSASNQLIDYQLIYFPWPRQDDFISWEKSVFWNENLVEPRQDLHFEHSGAYIAQYSDAVKMIYPMVFPEKITMDIFRFRNYESGFYVSERLKNAMESAGMTGIVYEVPEWLPK